MPTDSDFAGAQAVVDDIAERKAEAAREHERAVEAQVEAHDVLKRLSSSLRPSSTGGDHARHEEAKLTHDRASVVSANTSAELQALTREHDAARAKLEQMKREARIEDLQTREASYLSRCTSPLAKLGGALSPFVGVVVDVTRELEAERSEHKKANAELRACNETAERPASSHAMQAVAVSKLLEANPAIGMVVASRLFAWYANAAPHGEPDVSATEILEWLFGEVMRAALTEPPTPASDAVAAAQAMLATIASKRRVVEAWAALRPAKPTMTAPKSDASASKYAIDEGRSRFGSNPDGRGARRMG